MIRFLNASTKPVEQFVIVPGSFAITAWLYGSGDWAGAYAVLRAVLALG